jgi:predicted transposase YbfD/YdcC
MSSSPTLAAARSWYLLDLLAQVPDPRKKRGRRHALTGLLAVGVAAVIAGARSFAAIGQWAADAGPEALAALGAGRGPAEESTFRRAFALVSPDVPGRVLGAWLHTRAVRAGGRLVIAVDGKAVRGARDKAGNAPHLVAALAHGIGAVLGQVAVDARSNEIPAVRDLLKAFADLAGAVITTGALHTQRDTAQVIIGRHADYVMTVKASMPTLCKQLKKLPWAAVPAVSDVTKDHGRRARRTIKVALVPAWIELAGAAQVAQLRRTVTRKGKKTVEVVYLITSDRDADPAALAAWARGHWHIENKLHWVRDVTYQEDKSLVRTGNAPRVMASLRSLAISLLRLDATPTSPPPTATTPATHSGRSSYFKLHECDFAVSLQSIVRGIDVSESGTGGGSRSGVAAEGYSRAAGGVTPPAPSSSHWRPPARSRRPGHCLHRRRACRRCRRRLPPGMTGARFPRAPACGLQAGQGLRIRRHRRSLRHRRLRAGPGAHPRLADIVVGVPHGNAEPVPVLYGDRVRPAGTW